jgi:hypothetical protein
MQLARSLRGVVTSVAITLMFVAGPSSANSFELASGNAPAEVIIPRVIPVIYQDVSAGAGDATLVLRWTTLLTNAWFDAIAPYHPSAVGVYSRLGRLDGGADNYARNVAILHASYHVLNSLAPRRHFEWRAMLEQLGLNPDDDSVGNDAVGVGNRAGKAVVAARERDGMNQLGDAGGRTHNLIPYADYTGYKPVNTAYELRDPSRWQPNIVSNGNGLHQVQQFVTPQMRLTRPYSYDDPNMFKTPAPANSLPRGHFGRLAYKHQVDEVLAASASLTDEHKLLAELFDDKLRSLGFSAFFVHQTMLDGSIDAFVHYDFMVNLAAFDGAIATWNEKVRHDAVRPFSAIRWVYGNSLVNAWAGPGRGTDALPASQWRGYMNTADHPEYPSGSACFCSAHAEASRRFLGGDQFGWQVQFTPGSSGVEPGITPQASITLEWPTWSDFERQCGLSRLYGGVHFPAAIEAGHELCRPIGALAHEFLESHVNGTAPPPVAP